MVVKYTRREAFWNISADIPFRYSEAWWLQFREADGVERLWLHVPSVQKATPRHPTISDSSTLAMHLSVSGLSLPLNSIEN
jgi:hypothetical protein